MKKTQARIGSILMTLALVLTLLPATAMAVGVDCAGGPDCEHQAAIGSTHYATLAEAVSAAQPNETVQLLQDVELTGSLSIQTGITLDLNGCNITGNSYRLLLSGGTEDSPVTITDNQAEDFSDAGTISASQGLGVNGGSVVLRHINLTGTSQAVEICYGASGTSLVLDGVNIAVNSFGWEARGVYVQASAQVTVEPGTDAFPTTFSVVTNSSSGGAMPSIIESYHAGCSVEILGGTFSASGAGKGSAYVFGGSGSCEIRDGFFLLENTQTRFVSDSSNATVYGGRFNFKPDHCVPGYIPSEDKTSNDYPWQVIKQPVAQVGDTQYDTLQQAIDAAAPEGGITLLANITETNTLTFSKNVTIDDQGKFTLSLQGSPAVLVANGVTLPTQISPDSFEASSDAGNGMTAYYLTFEQAVSGSSNVKLLKDATLENAVNKTTDLVVDLNGYDLTSKSEYAFSFAGTAMPGEAEIVLKNSGDEIAHISGGIELGQLGRKTAYTLTIEPGVAVSGEAPLLVSGEVTVNIYGTLQVDAVKAATASETVAGIQGNGSSGYEGTVVNIFDGAVVDGGEYVGIYHPQAGTLNIHGGTVTGGSGVYVRSGTVSISGGEIIGTAEPGTSLEPSGAVSTGNALVIHNSSSYAGGEPVVSVTGGAFSSEKTSPVGSYGSGTVQPVTQFISGGTFSSQPDASCLAEGYVAVQNAETGTYGVTKPSYDEAAEVATATVVGEPETSVGEEIDPADELLAERAATTVAESDNSAALEAAADGIDQTPKQDAAITELGKAGVITITDGAVAGNDTVTIVTQPYFDITTTEYKVDQNAPSGNAITFDVTPMYRTIATTANVQADEPINWTGTGGTKNAVLLGSPQELEISDPIQMTLVLPAGFFGSSPEEPLEAYVTHVKEGGSVYVYDAEVAAEPSGGYTVTFNNPHGFSSLRITTNQPVATNGTNSYFDLQTAIEETGAGDTITLLDEISVDSTLVINKDLTIDLNSHSITGENGEIGCRALWVQSGTLTLTGAGTITTAAENDDASFVKGNSVIRVGKDNNAAGLVVGEKARVIAPASYGITVFGSGSKTYTLTVNGTVEVTDRDSGAESAIAGNGSTGGAPTVIIINSGAVVKAANNVAIYHPQKGTLTVNGGSITGVGGIQMCAGTLTVNGGTIAGTGTYDTISTYDGGGDGPILDGAAISVVDRSYPQGTPSVSLVKGVFTAKDPDGAIQAYSWENDTNKTTDWDEQEAPASVSGGSFSHPVNPGYLAATLNTQLKSASNPTAPYSYFNSLSAAMAKAGPDDEIVMLSEEEILYTVQFLGNGGTSAATLQVTSGTEVTLPDSSRTGYTFQGWKADNGTIYMDGTPYTVNADVAFTAQWAQNPSTVPDSPSASGDDDDDDYGITIPASSSIQGGSITVSPRGAAKGETVTITFRPDDGYELDKLSVTARSGGAVALTRKNDSQYTFRMPGSSVVIDVSFVQEGTAPAEEMNFTDVPESFWAYSEIRWAFDNGYMNGTTASTFSPAGTVSRQQVWMILARMSGADPADMAAAKAWAVENGISDGTNPGGAVTRQQLVALLYRFASRNDYDTSARADLSSYPDGASVASYAAEPMAWAVADGIIGGTTAGTLNPTGPSNRAQMAVILWRFYQTTAD